MTRFPILGLAVLIAAAIAGCGDPAPSTPLAPDQALPDTSKMSTEEINTLHRGANQGDRR